jgi:hypothetical protein
MYRIIYQIYGQINTCSHNDGAVPEETAVT